MSFYSLDNPTDNGAGLPLPLGRSGPVVFVVQGEDFSGGTVTLEVSLNSGDGAGVWVPLTYNGTPYQTNINACYVIDFLAQGMSLRAYLQGATAPVDVYAVFLQ